MGSPHGVSKDTSTRKKTQERSKARPTAVEAISKVSQYFKYWEAEYERNEAARREAYRKGGLAYVLDGEEIADTARAQERERLMVELAQQKACSAAKLAKLQDQLLGANDEIKWLKSRENSNGDQKNQAAANAIKKTKELEKENQKLHDQLKANTWVEVHFRSKFRQDKISGHRLTSTFQNVVRDLCQEKRLPFQETDFTFNGKSITDRGATLLELGITRDGDEVWYSKK